MIVFITGRFIKRMDDYYRRGLSTGRKSTLTEDHKKKWTIILTWRPKTVTFRNCALVSSENTSPQSGHDASREERSGPE